MPVRFFPYSVSLAAPLIAPALEGDANSVRTLEYIPGALVRGAVAAALGDPGDHPERQRLFHTLVLSGQVCYLNLYPVAGEERALPTPVSWRRAKYGADGPLYDLAAPRLPDVPLVAVGQPFVTLTAATPCPVAVDITARFHHQRDRVIGRPEAGGIFVLEAIDPGQTFAGLVAIAGTGSEVQERFQQVQAAMTQAALLLGRSRRAQYGAAAEALKWGEPGEREASGSRLLQGGLAAGAEFAALLTADYLGRHPVTGQVDPTALALELEAALGGRARVVRQRLAFRPVGGYNRTWGLPLPQGLAAKAGSVLVLQAVAPLAWADLLAMEQAGLGERRAEGFGRFVWLEPPQPVLHAGQPAPPPAPQVPPAAPPALVLRMQERILAAALAEAVARVAAEVTRSVPPGQIPTPSLLNRLRLTLRRPDGLEELARWLGEGEGALRRVAMGQLERCIVRWQGQRLTLRSCLQNLLTGDHGLTASLQLDALIQRCHLILPEQAQQVFWDHLASQTRQHLVDALLAGLSRQRRRQRKGEEGVDRA